MANDSYILLILESRQLGSTCNIIYITYMIRPKTNTWKDDLQKSTPCLNRCVNLVLMTSQLFTQCITGAQNFIRSLEKWYLIRLISISRAKPEINTQQTVHICFNLCSFLCFHVAGPSLALFRFTLHLLLETQFDGGSDYTPPLLGMGLVQREMV